MKEFLKSVKRAAVQVEENKGVTIPITFDMLLMIFGKSISKVDGTFIHNLDVSFREEADLKTRWERTFWVSFLFLE